jgi:hypothetical protein
MTLDDKVKILHKLRCDLNTAAFGLTLRWYFILMFNFPLIFYFNPSLSNDIYYITQFVHKQISLQWAIIMIFIYLFWISRPRSRTRFNSTQY